MGQSSVSELRHRKEGPSTPFLGVASNGAFGYLQLEAGFLDMSSVFWIFLLDGFLGGTRDTSFPIQNLRPGIQCQVKVFSFVCFSRGSQNQGEKSAKKVNLGTQNVVLCWREAWNGATTEAEKQKVSGASGVEEKSRSFRFPVEDRVESRIQDNNLLGCSTTSLILVLDAKRAPLAVASSQPESLPARIGQPCIPWQPYQCNWRAGASFVALRETRTP